MTERIDLHAFQLWLREERKATQTVATYCTDVRLALRTLPVQTIGMTRLDAVHYIEGLHTQGYQPATVNKKVNSLKVYHDYLVATGQWMEQPIRLRHDRVQIAAGSEHVVEALTDEEVERVLKEIEKERYSERDRLIVMVLLYTAVRVSELIQMKWSDIDTLTQTFVVRGKGGKVREIGLRQDVLDQLARYRTTERSTSRSTASGYGSSDFKKDSKPCKMKSIH